MVYTSNFSSCGHPHQAFSSILLQPHISFRNFRICTNIAGILQVLLCIVATCFITFTCSPVHKYWDDPFHGEGCLNNEALTIGITAADVAMDVVVLILPVPWLAKSQLDRNRKIGLISLFLLGSFVCPDGSNPSAFNLANQLCRRAV